MIYQSTVAFCFIFFCLFFYLPTFFILSCVFLYYSYFSLHLFLILSTNSATFSTFSFSLISTPILSSLIFHEWWDLGHCINFSINYKLHYNKLFRPILLPMVHKESQILLQLLVYSFFLSIYLLKSGMLLTILSQCPAFYLIPSLRQLQTVNLYWISHSQINYVFFTYYF